MIKIAFRSILINKVRSALTILGIAIGVALIFAVAITNRTIVSSFQDVVDDLGGSADLQVNEVAGGVFDESDIAEIEKTKGVDAAAPLIIKIVSLSREESQLPLRLLGVEPGKEKGFRNYKISDGRFLKESGDLILVSNWAADHEINLGDKVSVSGAGRDFDLKVTGLIKKIGPGAADDGAVGFIDIKFARKIFGLSGGVTQIDVKTGSGIDTAAVKKSLKDKLPVGLSVTRPAEKGAAIEAATSGVMGAFGSFGNLALFIGAFVAFNTMMMSVGQRLKEIGSMRLLGATKAQVFRVIILETVFYGLFGSLIGVPLGELMGGGLSTEVAAIYNITVTRVDAPLEWAAIAFAIGLASSFIAGVQPAVRAGGVAPVEIFRLGLSKSGYWLGRYGWAPGLVFIAVGTILFFSPVKNDYGTLVFSLSSALLFVGAAFFSVLIVTVLNRILSPLIRLIFGHEGRLAGDSIDRGKSRTALAVITLLASLSMIVAAGELRLADNAFLDNWMAAIIPFDLSVRNPLPLNITDVNKYASVDIGLKKKFEKVKGVAYVNPVKFETARGLGRDMFIISTEGESWKHTSSLKFDEGNRDRALDIFDRGGTVMISSTITGRHDLHVEDTIKLKTPSGQRGFKISGVFPEVANDGYVIYISRHDQIKYWNERSVDGFDITIKKGADLKATKRRLEKAVEGISGVSVVTGKDIRDEIRNSVNQFLAILNALVVVAVVVTALGIINTLAMSVYERVREIGILRAIGGSRAQIMKMVVAEAATIGIMGAVLGVFVGMAISWAIVVIAHLVGGWKVPFVFPGRFLAAAALISIAVSVTASFYPARAAAKIDIVDSLRYE